MGLFGCNCKRNCTLLAVVASLILGIVGAFLQITGTITVTPAFLWVASGVGVLYLAVLLVTAALSRRGLSGCCGRLGTVLTGILGSILFAVILLGVGIVATSVVSAILVGLLVGLLALTFTGTACLVKCLADCDD